MLIYIKMAKKYKSKLPKSKLSKSKSKSNLSKKLKKSKLSKKLKSKVGGRPISSISIIKKSAGYTPYVDYSRSIIPSIFDNFFSGMNKHCKSCNCRM